MEYLLGMDIGTTNQKAILSTLDGKPVASVSRRNETLVVENRAEQEPERWWKNTLEILAELEQKLGSGTGKAIRGICISGHTVSLLPVDAAGAPLRRAMIWMDSRSDSELTWLLEQIGRERFCSIVGAQPSPSFLPGKLLWFRKNEPELMNKTACLLQANSFITSRLTGRFTIDLDQAAKSQCLDVSHGQWSREIGEAIGVELDQLLPPPQSPQTIAGTVTRQAAEQTGLAEGTPVLTGCSDAVAAIWAMGLSGLGEAGESVGTTSLVFAGADRPSATTGPVVSHPFRPGTIPYLFDAPISTSGAAVEWFLKNLAGERLLQCRNAGGDVYELLSNMAAQSPPGSGGLLFLPYLRGERAPLWNSFARGMYVGLTLKTTQENMVRAMLEGCAFALRHVLECMTDAGAVVNSICLTGGGAKNAAWAQIKASVLGLPVRIMDDRAGNVPMGDIFLAADAFGLPIPEKNRPQAYQTVLPKPQEKKLYDEMYALYRRVYQNLEEEQKILEKISMRRS